MIFGIGLNLCFFKKLNKFLAHLFSSYLTVAIFVKLVVVEELLELEIINGRTSSILAFNNIYDHTETLFFIQITISIVIMFTPDIVYDFIDSLYHPFFAVFFSAFEDEYSLDVDLILKLLINQLLQTFLRLRLAIINYAKE